MSRVMSILWVAIFGGCGTITLERHLDTSATGIIDPEGICNHFAIEVSAVCDDSFPLLSCVEECVAEGGDLVGRHSVYQACAHDGPPPPAGCDGIYYCLEQAGLSCGRAR